MFLESCGEGMGVVALSQEVQIISLYRLQDGLNRGQAWAADRAGGQPPVKVGVVRRVDLFELLQLHWRLPPLARILLVAQSVLHRGARLQAHALLQSVQEDASYDRTLLRHHRLALHDGG